MSSRDKPRSSAASSSKKVATGKTKGSSSSSSSSSSSTHASNPQTSQPSCSSSAFTPTPRGSSKIQPLSASTSSSPIPSSQSISKKDTTIIISATKSKSVIADPNKRAHQRANIKHDRNASGPRILRKNVASNEQAKQSSQDESSGSSQEMTIANPPSDHTNELQQRGQQQGQLEQETNIDHSLDNAQASTDDDESTTLLESECTLSESEKCSALMSQVQGEEELVVGTPTTKNTAARLPDGWEEHTDKEGAYYWHKTTGLVQRTRPDWDEPKAMNKSKPIVLYHDDEEINQSSIVRTARTSSDEDDYTTLESGAALTMADDPTTLSEAISFVVYPLGCCEFDETELISANSTKAIQKCILRLLNRPENEETMCWGLSQTQPILMRLLDDHIQFTDISTQSLLRSQPIQTIKTWAVDDDNNFAFVVEDAPQVDSSANNAVESQADSVNFALLNGPTFMCYVFSSMDDDDMSLKVATKLNKEINRFREQMVARNRVETNRANICSQKMVDSKPLRLLAATNSRLALDNDQTDADEDLEDQFEVGGRNEQGQGSNDKHNDNNNDDDDDDDDLAESRETTLNVRYIGYVQVPRPMGIDVLNVAIDRCLADASKVQMNRLLAQHKSTNNGAGDGQPPDGGDHLAKFDGHLGADCALTKAKIHVSPSSVIVENEQTGQIIVECRIRYLTFMGISRRDIRWCGFIMQNTTNQSFVAHCFECHPTAGEVCEAIQTSCSRMYEKMVKRQRLKQQMDEATSIMPKSSKIRDTLAKTLSKIKLTPII